MSKKQGFTLVFTVVNYLEKSKAGDLIVEHPYMKLTVGNGGSSQRMLNFSYFDGFGSSFNGGTADMCTGLLLDGSTTHHVAIVADGGPNIVSFIVDGIYCDDSWSWLQPTGMSGVPSSDAFEVFSENVNHFGGRVDSMAVYDVALQTSEVVALFRSVVAMPQS